SIHRFIVDKVSKGSTCIGRRVDIAYVIGYEQVEVPEAVKIDTPDDIPLLDMPVVKRIKGRVLGYEPIVDDDNEICMSVIIEPDDNSEMIVSVPVDLITEGDFSEYLPMEVDQGLLSEEHNLFYDSLSAFCEILQQKYGEVVDVQEYNEQVLKFVSTLMSKLNIAHKNTYFVNNHAMSVHQRVLRDVEVEFATVDADVELTAISDVLDYTIGTWRFSEQHDISGDMKGYVVIATIHDDDDEIFDETNFSLRRVIEVSDPFYDFVLQSGYRGYLLVPSSEVINSRLHKNNYN
ncbi:hypothetical protein KDA11_05190, partial [Candidatus Saccharibacteria bacterium]|nr:hypothetical protein [Candidatus Saccharibacteria bacterium]